jgi:hypothetical protein
MLVVLDGGCGDRERRSVEAGASGGTAAALTDCVVVRSACTVCAGTGGL